MHTITIGGKAGDGIKAAGKLISGILNELGYHIFVLDDYPSLIRGGHNFNRITFDEKPLYSHYNETDVLVALDEQTIKNHKKYLKKNFVAIYDSNSFKSKQKDFVAIPAQNIVEKAGGIKIMKNTAMIGGLACVLGIEFDILKEVFKKAYPGKAELNIKIAEAGYNAAKKAKKICKLRRVGKPKILATGNMELGYGAVKAGLNTYIAYPMTPATTILNYLAGKAKEFKLKVIQPENEIAVINMAIGSAYAGSKTMIGTSGGGFALMTEALGLAGIAEIPLVAVESQRAGPSTGVPTYTAQSDLNFVLHAGSGEFPKIVIAPGTTEQCFYNSAEALYLAWKYQLPVIILSDKHLSENLKTVEIDETKAKKAEIKFAKGGANYKRYAFTKDGVSPFAIPGTPNTVVKSTSFEHDEIGLTIENARQVKAMLEKRGRKFKAVEKEVEKLESIKTYGTGKNLIITWGSSIGAVLEAAKSMKDTKVLQIIYMMPFPSKAVEQQLKSAKRMVCVEANYYGQLADLIRTKTGIEIKNRILRYDSREFEPCELLNELKRWFK